MRRLRLLPGFYIIDDRGSIRSLGDFLGDFTVLAFTGCSGTDHQFVTKLLGAIAAGNGAAEPVKVVGIDVHSSNRVNGWPTPVHCVEARKNLVAIDDADGTIRRSPGLLDLGNRSGNSTSCGRHRAVHASN